MKRVSNTRLMVLFSLILFYLNPCVYFNLHVVKSCDNHHAMPHDWPWLCFCEMKQGWRNEGLLLISQHWFQDFRVRVSVIISSSHLPNSFNQFLSGTLKCLIVFGCLIIVSSNSIFFCHQMIATCFTSCPQAHRRETHVNISIVFLWMNYKTYKCIYFRSSALNPSVLLFISEFHPKYTFNTEF